MPSLALITGASAGIGKELAIYHAKKGGDVILVARRKEALDNLKTELEKDYRINAFVFTADLSKAGAAQTLYDQVKKAGHEVNILMNNAGACAPLLALVFLACRTPLMTYSLYCRFWWTWQDY